MTTGSTARRPPLHGVRVLDLTRLLPGPVCTLHLADLGADVIKIEDPDGGDYARTMDARAGEMSAFYRMVNRNKRSVCLDLKHSADREAFLALCRQAHVVAEGFRPGVTARLGIDYATVRAANPAIVYCSITGYGLTGPYAQRAGHDINYLALAGVLDQSGTAGGPPALSNLQVADLLGGAQTAAIGILAALLDARATGEGRHVDVAMSEATLAHNVFALHALQTHGRTLPRGTDLLTGGYACYRVYATRDGRYMAVGALEEKFWRRFCDAMDRPDWAALQFATGEAGAALGGEVAAAFARESQAHWARVFAAIDCCVTPVLRLEEALADSHVQGRGVVVTGTDGLLQYAPPVRLGGDAFATARPAPRLGEHTQSVLAEFGLPDLPTR